MVPSSKNLSPATSTTQPLSSSFHSPRVSFYTSFNSASSCSCSCSSSSSFTPPFRLILRFSNARRRSTCPCAVSSPKVNAMAEVLKEASFKDEFAINNHKNIESRSRTFLDAKTEGELIGGIRKEVEAGRLPWNVAAGMKELYDNYKNAVFKCGTPMVTEVVLSNMSVVFDRVFMDVKVIQCIAFKALVFAYHNANVMYPYLIRILVFSPYHEAFREPFDYYNFGQIFFCPLIDFGKSYVGNISFFSDVEEKLKEGHNIVLISNHQSEADPAMISLLLERTNPYISENLTYVARDRVLTDPLCKPFSMGRNLVCVYSKKHMFDVPELVDMKKKANIRSLKEMASIFRAGSKIVWIAPSGGRDRPDPQTGEWYPGFRNAFARVLTEINGQAPFDTSSIDNIRRVSEVSDVPRHIYPLALLCHEIMPPPPQVEKEIGERRVISFSGAGLSIAPKIRFHEFAAAFKKLRTLVKEDFTNELYNSVTQNYNVLKSAIYDNQGLGASTPMVSLSQPWN